MPTYSVAQAKTQLSRLIDEALAGETVTITRHGKPVAAITVPVAPKRISPEFLAEMQRRREERGGLGIDAVAAVREMRGEEP